MARKPSILTAKTLAWKAIGRHKLTRASRCVTCGKKATQVGHFFHTGDKPNKNIRGNDLWYDLRNLHPQCSRCNKWLHGNQIMYTLFMLETYGLETILELAEAKDRKRIWPREEILLTADRFALGKK